MIVFGATGVTVDTVELYTRSDSAGSTGAQEVFEWLDGEYIKQIVSGRLYFQCHWN